ncbi:hypothetical protein MsAm2_14380 [Methanolapillus ohkumae]|uniref:Uncharacterized protein n=1 Tax=Methanolapillus ohkumae TaxID=3028298 RepID=A0AA96ZW59_9EURY|nr:hypothetical protein MsAm2_14380 [Methanosarcinaceae archaeon Am2]
MNQNMNQNTIYQKLRFFLPTILILLGYFASEISFSLNYEQPPPSGFICVVLGFIVAFVLTFLVFYLQISLEFSLNFKKSVLFPSFFVILGFLFPSLSTNLLNHPLPYDTIVIFFVPVLFWLGSGFKLSPAWYFGFTISAAGFYILYFFGQDWSFYLVAVYTGLVILFLIAFAYYQEKQEKQERFEKRE